MMDENTKNYLLAIGLSIIVLIGWQIFYAGPKIQEEQMRRKLLEQAKSEVSETSNLPKGGKVQSSGSVASSRPTPAAIVTSRPRDEVLKEAPRIMISSGKLSGSISLKGARIDDLVLKNYRQKVAKDSPPVVLLSPSGADKSYYAELGWIGSDKTVTVPGPETVWKAETQGELTPTNAVTLKWDNGSGLIFRRTISLDENYMFSIHQEIENNSAGAVTIYPYALIAKQGKPEASGFYILHEGLVGVIGEEGLQEIDYDSAVDDKLTKLSGTGGWLGITDKYWAAVLIPDQKLNYEARFTGRVERGKEYFQTDYILDGVNIPKGGTHSVKSRIYAGAKKAEIIEGYDEKLNIKNFDLLIDWGWFYFITKPIFHLLNAIYKLVGNFGLAIMGVTIIIKLIFFPLNNKAYKSMSKMKLLQPEMARIKERYGDDRMKQQEAMMALYKKEKVNPMSGCVPILFQIPVFFGLYKVLYGTIEMRHAPFFGWIQDLSAPDPTSLFNLFGLLPFDPPQFLVVGAWPIMMGISMWVQMRLNPTPTDELQKTLFAWMPVVFTFILAPFAAGLVIYWTWNNLLTIAQQSMIMRSQGVKIELWDNIKANLPWSKGEAKD